ncbi:hypothetical protein T08_5594 [Trichinella sp. T8]|nr:hypothetical protein T08_5594 [Trichinella sp. T8]
MAISSLLYSFVLTSNLKKLILIIQNLYYTIVLESKKGFFFALYLFGNLYLETVLQGAIEIDSFHFWEAFRSQLDPTPGILWNVNTTGPVDLTLIRDAWVKERRQAEQ